jgi:hypothetical protein
VGVGTRRFFERDRSLPALIVSMAYREHLPLPAQSRGVGLKAGLMA